MQRCGFRGEADDQMTSAVERKEVWLQRRERERGASTQGNAKGNVLSRPVVWKMSRFEFCEFLQLAGLKVLSGKGQ